MAAANSSTSVSARPAPSHSGLTNANPIMTAIIAIINPFFRGVFRQCVISYAPVTRQNSINRSISAPPRINGGKTTAMISAAVRMRCFT